MQKRARQMTDLAAPAAGEDRQHRALLIQPELTACAIPIRLNRHLAGEWMTDIV